MDGALTEMLNESWLAEIRDPDALWIDVDRLRTFRAPALLTLGDQSPLVFRLVVDRIAPVLTRSTTQTFAGAGHVPHLSHPEEHVRIIARFLTSLPR